MFSFKGFVIVGSFSLFLLGHSISWVGNSLISPDSALHTAIERNAQIEAVLANGDLKEERR